MTDMLEINNLIDRMRDSDSGLKRGSIAHELRGAIVELNARPGVTVAEAAKVLISGLEDPHYGDKHIPGWREVKWQEVYTAMTNDHAEAMEIMGHHDWPALLVTAMRAITGEPS